MKEEDGSYGVYGRINGSSFAGESGDIFSSEAFACDLRLRIRTVH
jgi:hypothetical protein